MMAEPEETLAKEIWNLPDNKKFRDFVKLSLPSIQYSKVFYIPRKLQQYFNLRFYEHKDPVFPMMHVEQVKEYGENLFKKGSYEESIRVRVNCPYKLAQKQDNCQKEKGKDSPNGLLDSISRMFQKQTKVPKTVIFHIHGGGFVSMSSFFHQTYTRLWATNLEVPIVSVDYGKAPDRPYPLGLHDSFEAYMWTLMTFKQVYEVYPEKIILVGDSAGGNICAALTTMLIQWKLPPPSGLVLVYPALNLNFLDYTPSLLTALNDMILPHTFLKICLRAYIRDAKFQPSKDPLISPILTPMDILAQYPPTSILVGNKDPFHDDCCRLVERLK